MALVNPIDPSTERVSACPVHFIWDGRGLGRSFVRGGFLGVIAAGMLVTAGQMVHVDVLKSGGLVVLVGSLASWLTGQALTALVRRRA
jgi:hypothetical protein